ncbi:MAG: SCO family protein [Bacteroidetes bacterium]|nr:SCO family protein [Bacteroidota bacterium]
MKKINLIIGLLITLFSCGEIKKDSSSQKIATEQEKLPFFNQPDWTPEWIEPGDPAYKKIHQIPSFSLVNQEGITITEKDVEGKIYVANFFFTTCRNICTKMTTNMHLIQEAFADDEQIYLISHSVTPESDSVPKLKKYALENKIRSDKWSLLTGDKSSIYRLAKQEYFAGDTIGFYQTGNEFLHTENFILIDKHRRIRGVYNGTLLVEIERIKEDIAILKREE